MEILQIVWLVLVVVFVILEASTASLVSVWFAAGALAALLVSLFWPWSYGIAAQVAAFLVVSLAALLCLRPLARKLVGNGRVPTNADANIGKLAQVVEEIRPERFGRVRLEHLVWTAKSSQVLPVGSFCRVLAIEGVKLVVEPARPDGAAASSNSKEDASV